MRWIGRASLLLAALSLGGLTACRGPLALRVKDAPSLDQAAQKAPGFAAKDHTGRPVSLEAAIAQGPAVLVFYRGHW